MRESGHPEGRRSDSPATARLLCAIAAIAYPAFGVVLALADPPGVDPIALRAPIWAGIVLVLVGSYASSWVRGCLPAALLAIIYAVTLHAAIVVVLNDLSHPSVIVALVVLAGFIATAPHTIMTEEHLHAYLAFAGLTSVGAVVAIERPESDPGLFLSSIGVVLALAFAAVRSHLRTLGRLRESEGLLLRDLVQKEANAAELLQSEARKTALLGAIPDVLLRLGPGGVGLDVQNADGGPLGALFREHGQAPLDLMLEGTRPTSVAAAVAAVRRSGEVCTVSASVGKDRRRDIEIRVARTDASECLALVRDVTQEKEVEARLRVAERLASLGTLAGGVAHEINNPLSYVSANADFVLDCLARLPEEHLLLLGGNDVTEALHELREGARRIGSIVQGLKSQTREDDEALVPTDPNEAVETAVRILDNQIRYRARIELALGSVPPVLARPQHLVQVIVNLLANALQAFPERPSDRNCIRIETRARGDVIALRVSDNGTGIPESVRHRIFDPFFTTKPPNVGTGLGLYLCHQYLSAASATIEVESTSDEGATFLVCLRPTEGTAVPSVLPGHSSSRLPPSRILVVDDEPLVARSLSRMLRGHDLVLAGDGEAALWECLSRDFDLILCDVMMPRLDGVGFHAALREHRPKLADRIVFITGGTFTPATREFLGRVPNELVEKPIHPEGLFDAARRQLAAAGARESLIARSA